MGTGWRCTTKTHDLQVEEVVMTPLLVLPHARPLTRSLFRDPAGYGVEVPSLSERTEFRRTAPVLRGPGQGWDADAVSLAPKPGPFLLTPSPTFSFVTPIQECHRKKLTHLSKKKSVSFSIRTHFQRKNVGCRHTTVPRDPLGPRRWLSVALESSSTRTWSQSSTYVARSDLKGHPKECRGLKRP